MIRPLTNFLTTTIISMSILNVSFSTELKASLVVVITSMIVTLIQQLLKFFVKMIEKSDLKEENKEALKDILDGIIEDSVSLIDNKGKEEDNGKTNRKERDVENREDS